MQIAPATNRIVARRIRVGLVTVPSVGTPFGRPSRPTEPSSSRNLDNTVSRIDPETNAVFETIEVGPGPTVIRPGFGDLWLTHLRGSEVWSIHVG